jgi:signal transduction histidine kinase
MGDAGDLAAVPLTHAGWALTSPRLSAAPDIPENSAQAQADNRAFVSMAVHELRSPAAVILGYADTIDNRWADLSPHDLQRMVHAIQRSSRHLNRLISDLLVASRITAGELPVNLSVVPVRPLLQLAAEVATANGQPVHLDSEPDLMVLADGDRLEQVVTVLVDNAVQHGAPPVRLSARPKDADIEIVVADSGPGVDRASRTELFQRFSQLSRGKAGSNGLGLSIARDLARLMDGDLTYREAEVGAAFVVTMRSALPPRPIMQARSAQVH